MVRAAIARAVENAAEGIFDPTPRDPKRCRYCDYRRSCRIATVPGLAAEDEEAEE
jgi:CRISPR/Cas system-associated exonuclease Cas4 (RecB family)